MTASGVILGNPSVETLGMRQVVNSDIERFCEECDTFIKRQYDEIIKGNPSSELQQRHRNELKWALRTAKLLECVAADPDSLSRSSEELLKSKIWQLEKSWK